MNKIIAFVLALLAFPIHAASIWGATNRAPATGTMRFPVDTSSSSSPGYLNITAVNAYVWGNPTGTLPVVNGGTNLTAATDDNVMVGNGTTWQSKALTSCSATTSAMTYNTTTNAFSCNTLVSASDTQTLTNKTLSGQVITTGTALTGSNLSSCGTSPSITGTDRKGTVTFGTSTAGCTITFSTAYASAPVCVFSPVDEPAVNSAAYIASISTTEFRITGINAVGGEIFTYICEG